MSSPGSVIMQSGFSSMPKVWVFFFSKIFLRVFIESSKSCLVLKSLQLAVFALTHSLFVCFLFIFEVVA